MRSDLLAEGYGESLPDFGSEMIAGLLRSTLTMDSSSPRGPEYEVAFR